MQGEINVRGELPGPVQGTCALVALDGVFLRGGDVVGVGVCRAAKNDEGVDPSGEGLGCGGIADGVAPAAAGHGACFGGGDDDEELADTEGLDVDDVGGPGVGGGHLADVEEDGLGLLAGFLLGGGGAEEAADDGPEGVVGGARVALGEVEGAGAVGRAGCEGVAEGGGAGLDEGAVGEGEFVVLHVLEVVEGADGGADDVG